jgi:hypothetical protein
VWRPLTESFQVKVEISNGHHTCWPMNCVNKELNERALFSMCCRHNNELNFVKL